VDRRSGEWKGKSGIQGATLAGNRGHVRQTLFLPAMVAARFNADMNAELEALTKGGKPAITAVMHELVAVANAPLRDDRLWAPKPARPTRIL